jgi:hypothetical protein
MRKIVIAGLMTLFVGGCSHYAASKSADYHQQKADRAAERGNYGVAADQQRKADVDRDRAATAPLP